MREFNPALESAVGGLQIIGFALQPGERLRQLLQFRDEGRLLRRPGGHLLQNGLLFGFQRGKFLTQGGDVFFNRLNPAQVIFSRIGDLGNLRGQRGDHQQ